MAIKIKATNELLRLAEQMGTIVSTKRDDYYYFPFWIKVKPDGSKELVRFEKLPEDVRQYIQTKRNELVTPTEVLNLHVDAEEVKGGDS